MAGRYSDEVRGRAERRLRAGHSVAAIAGDTGISSSTLYRWSRELAVPAAPDEPVGKLIDITGPGITEQWGVTATDLGASILAPNGKLVSVFGDTFSGHNVGEGDWRSPVVLIGTGDAT